MKVNGIQSTDYITFNGKRLDKNAVRRLIEENPYSLNEPNQRLISQAIENLGKVKGEKNIQFLLDAAAKNRYSTSITLQDAPKNDWKSKLLAAAASALAITPLANSALTERLNELQQPQSITIEEQEILKLREQLLEAVDLEQINNETVGSMKDFTKNLDYFIISSETSIEHKKYVLERLNHFMSDDYEINPQLADKKSIVIAEMINDMAINVPGNKAPNIKAVNQKQHGICAAISIVRKKLAYEDKPNYVDSILSELDSSDVIKVYDRNRLGSGEKIEVQKVPVDFRAALAKGYRIIDASTMHWMQIGLMSGANNIAYNVYNPFDDENFDVKNDSFFVANFENEDLANTQKYYQALVKAKSVIESYKAAKIKGKEAEIHTRQSLSKTMREAGDIGNLIKDKLSIAAPNLSIKNIQNIYAGILALQKSYSYEINDGDKFSYIHNEEDEIKIGKIKQYILDKAQIDSIDDETIETIYFMVNEYHSLTDSKSKPSAIKKATKLYEIGAVYRYQTIMGLNDKKVLDSAIVSEGLPNRETLLLDTIDTLIEKLENDSVHSSLILEQLQQSAFEDTDGSKEQIIDHLYELKNILTYHLTESLDNLYGALTMGNRKAALLSYIEHTLNYIKEGNTDVIEPLSRKFGVKKSIKNVLRVLESDRQNLINGDEKTYSKLFDKYGSVSQLEFINNIFQDFMEKSKSEENQEIVLNFIAVNGINIEDGEEAVVDRLNDIDHNIQAITNYVNQVVEALRIVDKNGDVLYSADPKDVIIKKMENDHRIVSAKQLRELQTHLDKISKVRSSDEFQSRHGKIKDKTLTLFSNSEKNTLNEIEKMIDPMFSLVQKQLKYIRTDMKDYLEEIAHLAGINDGNYWLHEEGSSGLYSYQQVRILEYMTGRSHYIAKDLDDAIEKIKTSYASGLSGSSVFHDRPGFHCQYIADIKPIKLSNGEIKEVLFHDNSWGASEKENTWVDSNGLLRTDYSDNRGGTLGYIVNDNFQNGNFVDRILSDMILRTAPDKTESRAYKRIKNVDRDIKMPQYSDIILEGKSRDIKHISDQIHDAIFVTDNRYLDKFKKLGEVYTEAELQAMITDIRGVGKDWKAKYETLKRRIFSETGTSISSKEDYDKLADDDYLKVVLEKIALKQNYQLTGQENSIAQVRNVRELSKFRAAQKTRALNSFKYAFAKSLSVIDYLADSFGDKEFLEMEAILKKHGINLTDDELNSIGEVFDVDRDRYDGSAKTTINLMLENLRADINAVVSDVAVQQELEDFFRDFLTDKLYFNKEDLDLTDLDNQKISHIIEFIDRVYDPEDDDEFVEIYRRIQDMTNEEFKQEILSKASYEDMGVKSATGYDILKKIQMYNEDANTTFLNTIYFDSLVSDWDEKSYTMHYKYDKLFRTARLTSNYKFGTMFRDLHYSLSLLDYPKMFNKYKAKNLEKYGAYPAYPRVEYLTDEHIHHSYDSCIDKLEKHVDTIKTLKEQIQNYEIAHLLKRLKKASRKGMVITGDNYSYLNQLFGRLVTINYNDSSVKEVTDAAEAMLEFEEGTSWKEYLPYIDIIIGRLTDFENTTPKELLEQAIESNKNELLANKRLFVETFIQPKHKVRVAEKYNRLEQAMINQDAVTVEELKEDLLFDFRQYHILNDPEQLLIQYILSCAKDSGVHSLNELYEKLLLRAIDYAKLVEIQDIIMEAIQDGVALNAKSRFDKHMLSFNNGEYSMGSDEMINYMTNHLILDGQFETALMFLEKLGLSEKYVKFAGESFDYDKLSEIITESYTLSDNFAKFQSELEPILEEVQKAFDDNNCDYVTILDKLRADIVQKAVDNSLDDEFIKPLLNGIDSIEYACENNPMAQKNIVFTTVMYQSKQRAVEEVRKEIESKDEILSSNTTIVNFINNILLPTGSEADTMRVDINNRFEQLVNLRQSYIDLQGEENSDKI